VCGVGASLFGCHSLTHTYRIALCRLVTLNGMDSSLAWSGVAWRTSGAGATLRSIGILIVAGTALPSFALQF
jgi:hypothetical protein